MAQKGEVLLSRSQTAGAAVTENRFVKASGSNVIHTAADGDLALGVALTAAANEDNVSVAVIGSAWVAAAAAVTKGAQVMAAADGKAKPHTGTNNVAGVALSAAAADGDLIEILLR